MNVFEKVGLRKVINASGKMTVLGATAVNEQIGDSLKQAAQDFVIIDELMDYTSSVIAKYTGAEDGCPTSSASAGIAISTAAVIAGSNLSSIERLPDSIGLKNEIVIQKGHLIHYGGNIGQMLRLGGAKVVEVGAANKVESEHIENAITEQTAALFYVKSHHAVQKGMQSIEAMLEIAKKYQIPLIIDAAAEEDFRKYIGLGADIVIYSGGKALEGPTSGFICGKATYMVACRKQYKGIGRAMKIGKEAMVGLITALEMYDENADSTNAQMEKMTALCDLLKDQPGLTCSIMQDEAGRAIYRARIEVDEKLTGIHATEIATKLESGNPSIHLRAHYANTGVLLVDPRPLLADQEQLIAKEILTIIREAE